MVAHHRRVEHAEAKAEGIRAGKQLLFDHRRATVEHGRIGSRPAKHRMQDAVEPGCSADELLVRLA